MEAISKLSVADLLKGAVKHDPRPFWYDMVNKKQVRFSNPKQFRRYLRENSLGHTQSRGRQLFYLPKPI